MVLRILRLKLHQDLASTILLKSSKTKGQISLSWTQTSFFTTSSITYSNKGHIEQFQTFKFHQNSKHTTLEISQCRTKHFCFTLIRNHFFYDFVSFFSFLSFGSDHIFLFFLRLIGIQFSSFNPTLIS